MSSRYRPLKYREVVRILNNFGFEQGEKRATSHERWYLYRNNQNYAVTLPYYGANKEVRKGTLNSIIRQSGFSKKEFYEALKK